MPAPALSPEILDQLTRLMDDARAAATAAGRPGVDGRTWQVPAGTAGDPQDPATFRTALPRYELNQRYVDALVSGAMPQGGRVGDLIVQKSAVDYLGCMERALHAAHASRLRCFAWSAARHAGHADKTYGVFAAVREDLQAVLAAAAGTGADPTGGSA